jgi:hypothetical protein
MIIYKAPMIHGITYGALFELLDSSLGAVPRPDRKRQIEGLWHCSSHHGDKSLK